MPIRPVMVESDDQLIGLQRGGLRRWADCSKCDRRTAALPLAPASSSRPPRGFHNHRIPPWSATTVKVGATGCDTPPDFGRP